MADNVDNCLNCGAVIKLQDKFCTDCGQKNRSSRLTIKELFKDFLGDYFTFDNKLFRSIFPLLFKPGFLTNEYINGRRIKYIPPLRMYIFISIIYFFVMSLSAEEIIPVPEISGKEEKQKSDLVISFGGEDVSISTIKKAYEEGNEASLLDSVGMERTPFRISVAKMFAKQYVKFDKNPDGYAPQVLKTASIMMFLIMPIFALLLKLLYIRRGYFYIDHLIFSFHFHSFLFLLLILLYFFIDIIPGISIMLITLLILFYLYKSLRNVYQQERGKTILKMSALLSSGFVILLFTFLSTMLVSFLLF